MFRKWTIAFETTIPGIKIELKQMLISRSKKGRQNILRVLTYHRVANTVDSQFLNPRLISASPKTFNKQMRHLAKNYKVVSIQQVLDTVETHYQLPENAVLITFDDAYIDFKEFAWPILQKYHLPVTLFVPTVFPNHPERSFWWDRLCRAFNNTSETSVEIDGVGFISLTTREERFKKLRMVQDFIKSLSHEEAISLVEQICSLLKVPEIEKKSVLDWNEIRQISKQGVTIGAHTQTHPMLNQMMSKGIRKEIKSSQEDLRREIGKVLPIFCLPGGGANNDVYSILQENGIKLAFSTIDGINDMNTANALSLKRTNITPRTTLIIFRFRLLTHLAQFDVWRHRKITTHVRRNFVHKEPANLHISHMNSTKNQYSDQKPKIAYIMSRFPKISETFILNEIIAVKKLGVCVEIFPLIRERQKVVHEEAAALVKTAHFFPFLSLSILKANWFFILQRPVDYVKTLVNVLGGTFGSFNFFIGALGIFPKSVCIAQEMMELGITHIHAHFATHPTVAALIVYRLTGIPYSFTGHGSDLHVERRMLDKKVEMASFVITVSNYNKKLIVNECGKMYRHKIHVIHCGIDSELFCPAVEEKKNQVFQILCIASFEEVKGHEYLIRACELLKERDIQFECHLVGDGPLREKIEHQCKSSSLNGSIRFHGALTRTEIAKLFHKVDVMALPSVPTRNGKREGIPVVLMEAMACGIPVISSNISGIPELVTHYVTGILTEPGDVTGIADALQNLYEDSSFRKKLGTAGRDYVLKEFNLDRCAEQLVGLLLNRQKICNKAVSDLRSNGPELVHESVMQDKAI